MRLLARAALLLPIIVLGPAFAQIRSGTITGSVKDASGAIVPNAGVALMHQETNIPANAVANESGQFTFPYLAAGTYSLTVNAPGFVNFKQSGINLSTAQTVRVDPTLKVSTVETTVEVAAEHVPCTGGAAGSSRFLANWPFRVASKSAGLVNTLRLYPTRRVVHHP